LNTKFYVAFPCWRPVALQTALLKEGDVRNDDGRRKWYCFSIYLDRQTDENAATNRPAGFQVQNRTRDSCNEEMPAGMLVTLHVVTLDEKKSNPLPDEARSDVKAKCLPSRKTEFQPNPIPSLLRLQLTVIYARGFK